MPYFTDEEMEAREGMWFVWDHEDRLRPSWIVDSRNSECPKCQVSNSLICFDKSSFFFFNFYFNGLGLDVMVFPVMHWISVLFIQNESTSNIVPTYSLPGCMYLLLDIWKLLQQSDRNWCFLWCVCVCVCVCVEVLEAALWALLGSETQELVLERAVP